MGFRYQASAVHAHRDAPAKSDVLAWRTRIGTKYRDQLGAPLAWDEDSAFMDYAVPYYAAQSALLTLAAVLTVRKPGETLPGPGAWVQPDIREVPAMRPEVARLGFAGPYPQLLLDATFWFPFERNMIISEPDWAGTPARCGSLARLLDELDELRLFIARTNRNATTVDDDDDSPKDMLQGAWQASSALKRLCTAAIANRVPVMLVE